MPQQQLLLSLLDQCPDVWSRVLLPKLVADKSAGNCALACSRLRQLCQDSQQQLNLASLDGSSLDGSSNFDVLPQHFPHCTTVKFTLGSERSYSAAPALIDALSRFVVLSFKTSAFDTAEDSISLAVLHPSKHNALSTTSPTLTFLIYVDRRLPTLMLICLSVEGPCPSSVGLSMAIDIISRQLPHLRSLTLTPKHSWEQQFGSSSAA